MSKTNRENAARLPVLGTSAASLGSNCNNMRRQRRFGTIFAATVAAVGVGSFFSIGSAQAGNTLVTVSDATDLSAPATYGGNLPTVTNDVEFQSITYTNPTLFSTNGANLSYGTLDDVNTTQSLIISDTSSGSITLNTAANGVSGTAADLLYVASERILPFRAALAP